MAAHMCRAVQGAELEEFLNSGTISAPVSFPLKCAVTVELDFLESPDGSEIRFGPHTDGKFYLDERYTYGLEHLRLSLTLVRLTDFKACRLFDELAP